MSQQYAPYKPSDTYSHDWTKLYGFGNLKIVNLDKQNKIDVKSNKYNHIERPEEETPVPKNCLDMNLTLERLMHVNSYQNL